MADVDIDREQLKALGAKKLEKFKKKKKAGESPQQSAMSPENNGNHVVPEEGSDPQPFETASALAPAVAEAPSQSLFHKSETPPHRAASPLASPHDTLAFHHGDMFGAGPNGRPAADGSVQRSPSTHGETLAVELAAMEQRLAHEAQRVASLQGELDAGRAVSVRLEAERETLSQHVAQLEATLQTEQAKRQQAEEVVGRLQGGQANIETEMEEAQAQAQREKDALQAQLESLQQQVETVTTQLAEAQAQAQRADTVQRENDALQTQLEGMRQQLEQKAKQLAATQALALGADGLQQERDDLLAQLDAMRQEASAVEADLRQQLEGYREANRGLAEQVDTMHGTVTAAEATELRQRNLGLQDEVTSLEQALATAKAEARRLGHALDEAVHRADAAQAEAQGLREAGVGAAGLQAQLAALRAKNNELYDQTGMLQGEADALHEEVARMLTQQAEADGQLAQLRSERTRLQARCEALQRDHDALQARLAQADSGAVESASQQAAHWQAQAEDLQAQLHEASARAQAAEETVRQLQAELGTVGAERSALLGQVQALDALQGQKDQLADVVAATKAQVADLTAQLNARDEAQRAAEAEAGQRQAETQRLQQRVEELAGTMGGLREELQLAQEVGAAGSMLEDQLGALQAELARLQAQAKATEDELDAWAERQAEWEQRESRLVGQLREMADAAAGEGQGQDSELQRARQEAIELQEESSRQQQEISSLRAALRDMRMARDGLASDAARRAEEASHVEQHLRDSLARAEREIADLQAAAPAQAVRPSEGSEEKQLLLADNHRLQGEVAALAKRLQAATAELAQARAQQPPSTPTSDPEVHHHHTPSKESAHDQESSLLESCQHESDEHESGQYESGQHESGQHESGQHESEQHELGQEEPGHEHTGQDESLLEESVVEEQPPTAEELLVQLQAQQQRNSVLQEQVSTLQGQVAELEVKARDPLPGRLDALLGELKTLSTSVAPVASTIPEVPPPLPATQLHGQQVVFLLECYMALYNQYRLLANPPARTPAGRPGSTALGQRGQALRLQNQALLSKTTTPAARTRPASTSSVPSSTARRTPAQPATTPTRKPPAARTPASSSRAPAKVEYHVGDRVKIKGKAGIHATVMYAGPTDFAPGHWYGLKLDTPDGKHDGSVQGKVYFSCPDRYGVFVKDDKLEKC